MSQSLSVLIVDDDTATRYLTKRVLHKFKSPYELRIKEAVNGLEGLEHISTLSYIPDIILLDLQMPVLDGIGFLNLYRQLLFPVGSTPSVFILSTVPSDFDPVNESIKKLVKGVFKKPLLEHHIHDIFLSLDLQGSNN